MKAEYRIVLHAHCRKCAPKKPRNVSMAGWAKTQSGLTAEGIQVWCTRCDMEVAHFTPEELTKLLTQFPGCDACECCPGGKHVGN